MREEMKGARREERRIWTKREKQDRRDRYSSRWIEEAKRDERKEERDRRAGGRESRGPEGEPATPQKTAGSCN